MDNSYMDYTQMITEGHVDRKLKTGDMIMEGRLSLLKLILQNHLLSELSSALTS